MQEADGGVAWTSAVHLSVLLPDADAGSLRSATAAAYLPARRLLAVGNATGQLAILQGKRHLSVALCAVSNAHPAAATAVEFVPSGVASSRPGARVLVASACMTGTIVLSELMQATYRGPAQGSASVAAAVGERAPLRGELNVLVVLGEAAAQVCALVLAPAPCDATNTAGTSQIDEDPAAIARVHVSGGCEDFAVKEGATDAEARPAPQQCGHVGSAHAWRLLAACADGKVHCWQVTPDEGSCAQYCGIAATTTAAASPIALVVAPSPRLASACEDGSHHAASSSEAATSSGWLLAACGDRCVRAWDLGSVSLEPLPLSVEPAALPEASTTQAVLPMADQPRDINHLTAAIRPGADVDDVVKTASTLCQQVQPSRPADAADSEPVRASAAAEPVLAPLQAARKSATPAPTAAAAPRATQHASAQRLGQRPRGTALGSAAVLQPLIGAALAAPISEQPGGASALPGALCTHAAADAQIRECEREGHARQCIAAASTMSGRAARIRDAHASALPRVWRGDVAGAVNSVTAAGALNADFVALAAAAGPAAWLRAARAHAEQLAACGETHLAVAYLCAAEEWEGAASVYADAGLLEEAVLLAERHLDEGIGALQTLRRQLLVKLEQSGAAGRPAVARWHAAVAAAAGLPRAPAASQSCAKEAEPEQLPAMSAVSRNPAASDLQSDESPTGAAQPHLAPVLAASSAGGSASDTLEHADSVSEGQPLTAYAAEALPETQVEEGALSELAELMLGSADVVTPDAATDGVLPAAADSTEAAPAEVLSGLSAAQVVAYQRVEQALAPRDWARLRRQCQAALADGHDALAAASHEHRDGLVSDVVGHSIAVGAGQGAQLDAPLHDEPFEGFGIDLLAGNDAAGDDSEMYGRPMHQSRASLGQHVEERVAAMVCVSEDGARAFVQLAVHSVTVRGEPVLAAWSSAILSHPGVADAVAAA